MRSFRTIFLLVVLPLFFVQLPAEAEATGRNAEGVSEDEPAEKVTGSKLGAPSITPTFPEDGAVDVSLDAIIQLFFDQGIIGQALSNIEVSEQGEATLTGLDISVESGSAIYISHAGLNPGPTYFVDVPTGVVHNENEDENLGYNFSLTTVSSPVIESTSPENGALVSGDIFISVTFDQEVLVTDAGLSGVELYDNYGYPVSGVSASLIDSTIHVEHNTLSPGSYSLYIPAGVVENSSGETNNAETLSFTVDDPPSVQSVDPANEEVSASLTDPLLANFDDEVRIIDHSEILIVNSLGDTLDNVTASLGLSKVAGGDVTSTEVVISHDTFESNTVYSAIIGAGAVKNDAGVYNERYTWVFTTANAEQPQIVSTSPANGGMDVAVDSTIYIGVDQVITTVNAGGIEIVDSSENMVSGIIPVILGVGKVTSSGEDVKSTIAVIHSDFEKGETYTVKVGNNGLKNADGTGNAEYSWSFATVLGEPIPVTHTPADNATDVAVNTDVSVTFDQDILPNETVVSITEVGSEISLSGVDYSVSGQTLTITHPGLEYETEYVVEVYSGSVINSDGETNSAISWTFTTEAASLLKVVDIFPTNNQSGVHLDSEITVGFSQNIFARELAQISITDSSGEEIPVASATIEDNNLHITHEGLAHGEIYTVTIPANTVRDGAATANEALSWSFRTIVAPPAPQLTVPADAETGVPLDNTVSIEFDQTVTTVDLAGITIQDENGNAVQDITATLTDQVLTISHLDFDHGTLYTVTIPTGSVRNSEETHNDAFSWSFTTIQDAPQITTTFPEHQATAVAPDAPLEAGFNQEVTSVDLTGITIKDANGNEMSGVSASLADNTTLNITHPDFSDQTTYTITIPAGAVKNADDVANISHAWSFTTVMAAPEVVSTMPTNNEEEVDIAQNLSVTFNQVLTAADLGSIQLIDSNGTALNGVMAAVNDKTISITHNGLSYNETYTVSIPAGAVENSDGEPNNEYSWMFSTVLNVPEVVELSPQADLTGAVVDAEVFAVFDQEIEEHDLSGISISNSGGSEIGGLSVQLSGQTVTINHNDFENGETYDVLIPANSVVNSNQVGNEKITWRFRTIMSPPEVNSVNPEDDATIVAVDESVFITFTQNISPADTDGITIQDSQGNGVEGISISVNGNVLNISHNDFVHGTVYRVEVPANSIENADGLGNNKVTWAFTTILAPPSVTETVPMNQSQSAPLDSEVSLIFDQEVTANELGSIRILDADDNELSNVNAGITGAKLEITHDDFLGNSTYKVEVPANSVINGDGVGNVEYTWSFKTILNISEEVTIQVNRTFGEAASSKDYRMVALPGNVNEPVGNVFPGDPVSDWQAFWDNGAAEDYLVKYDGSEIFRLMPGNGFWVTSTKALEYNKSIDAVSLNEQNQVAIPLHNGWNIISNPLDIDVRWSDVERVNEADLQPVWGFESVFESTDIFRSARGGEAFYFLNDTGLQKLLVPYADANSPGKENTVIGEQDIRISVVEKGEESSISTLTLMQAEDEQKKDVIAPPLGFEATSLRFVGTGQPASARSKSLARIYKHIDFTGQKVAMQLYAEPKEKVTLRIEGWDATIADEFVVINEASGIAYDISEKETISFTPQSEESTLYLVLGNSEYVRSEEKNYVPDKIQLLQNYPNPFNPVTMISFSIPEQSQVRLRVFNVLGREVASLVNRVMPAGHHAVQFDASGKASGLYIAVIEIGDTRLLRKMMLMK
ncbi:MAG: T9SS type A sorting domain-containing protein [Balneolaceae bacterium]|nr:T9SS type A sorting domain-containing protein [Balneolaceae bacterium]